QFAALQAAGVDKRRVSTKQPVARFARTEAALQPWRGERTARFRHKARKGMIGKGATWLYL
ncbi:MAG: hypothetical protein KGI54_16690, partial [Pseudomonadota bacterium]|nr:hypothetical protein [Pseudomonadota bacterium]